MDLPRSHAVLAAYARINEAMWELYRRGEMDPRTLAHERFRSLLLHVGRDARLARPLARRYLARLSQRADLMPGCRRTLTLLARRYRLGVVTNGYDRVQRSRLRAARLGDFFDVVVTSEGCGYAKPDPRILGVALSALRLKPREALYVGDDPKTDGGAARAAGVPFCWVDQGAPLPDGVRLPRRRVSSLAGLARLLGARGL